MPDRPRAHVCRTAGLTTPETKDSLHERDFHEWARAQAAALRAAGEGRAVALDWENLAEEIESLGRSDRREIRERFETIVGHLLKLRQGVNDLPREVWRGALARARDGIEALLEKSPGLRRHLPELAELARGRGERAARRGLVACGDFSLAKQPGPHTLDQLLSDGWPDQPRPG